MTHSIEQEKTQTPNRVLATCLLAGRIMIEGGSEMYRVEDTMRRIAFNAGQPQTLVFTTPTGILPASKINRIFRNGRLANARLIWKKSPG